jgi:hypothetical protein
MNMDFKLPVITRGTPRGKKKPRQVLATVTVSIDIREIRPRDLTAVASVHFPPGEPTELTDFVSIDGAIFVRIGEATEFSTSITLYGAEGPNFAFVDTNRRVRRLIDNYAYNGEGLFPTALWNARKANQPLFLTDLSEVGLESWYEKGVDDQITRFEDRCKRLVISEGCLWARVAEPVLALDFLDHEKFHSVSVRPLMRPFEGIGKGSDRIDPPQAIFRLDQLDRLFDFCRASGISETWLPQWMPGRVVINDAIRLSVDSERASIYSSASRLTKRIYGISWIPDHPLLDDLYRLVEGFTEDDCPDELGDVLSGLVELHRSGTRVFRTEFDVTVTDYVVKMWDNREISMAPEGPSAPINP